MIIDRQWLERQNACNEGKEFFLSEEILTLDAGTRNLIKKEKLNWANWLVTHAMSHTQKVMYAVYAAKQVLRLYEKYYPNDRRPRTAIQTAIQFAKNPTEKNKTAASAAAYAAYAASAAAYAASAAADAASAAAYAASAAYAAASAAAYAAYAASAAAYAASAAAYAAYAAADAASAAADAADAASAAYAAYAAMKIKIILYGLQLIKKENKSYVKSNT